MNREIIKNLVKKHNIISLYYCESGSRVWKFESTDSDFDIRGFHLPILDDYLSYHSLIEQVEDLEGGIDFVSFNLDKTFLLLEKSNPNVLEWLRSDMVYFNHFPNFADFVAQVNGLMNLKTLYLHYFNISKGHYDKYLQTGMKITNKIMLYVLRGLLSCLYIKKFQEIPPLNFYDLLKKTDLREERIAYISDLLVDKKKGGENDVYNKKEEVVAIIVELLKIVSKVEIKDTGNLDKLRCYLREVSRSLKRKYYL